MKKYLLLLVLGLCTLGQTWAQCTLLTNATPGITLVHQNTNCFNNSGVAFNPLRNLYYGVRAGNPSFPLETWSSIGTPLYNTTAGFDWRGMWWNPTTSQLEGNGFSGSGVWRADLNASGFALNTGANIFTGMSQPNSQSCGDLDWQSYEILYYDNGNISRYSRSTNAFLGSYPLTGTPVALSNINAYTVMYTGCTGMEIALLDYVNKRVYLYNKATGAYSGASQLPATAITTNAFRVSWANDLIWLFNVADFTWYSYRVFSPTLATTLPTLKASYSTGKVNLSWKTDAEVNVNSFVLERSIDGNTFVNLAEIPAKGNLSKETNYAEIDYNPYSGINYYRLALKDKDGGLRYTEKVSVTPPTTEIVMYPNPTQDMVTLIGLGQNVTVDIYSNTGALVVTEQASQQTRIDVQNLPKGIYLVKIISNTQTMVKKLILQ